MSWANLLKKQTKTPLEINSGLSNNNTNSSNNTNVNLDVETKEEFNVDDYCDNYIRPKLFDKLVDIILESRHNRYQLTEHIDTDDLVEFFYNYIDFEHIEKTINDNEEAVVGAIYN